MTSFIWRLPVCLGQPHTYLPCLLCTSVSDLTASITTTASAILQRLNLSKVSAACHVDPALCDNRSLTHYHLFEERPGTCRRSSGSRTRPCAVHPGGPSEAGVGEVLSTASLRHPTTCSGACTSRSPSPWASSPVQSSTSLTLLTSGPGSDQVHHPRLPLPTPPCLALTDSYRPQPQRTGRPHPNSSQPPVVSSRNLTCLAAGPADTLFLPLPLQLPNTVPQPERA